MKNLWCWKYGLVEKKVLIRLKRYRRGLICFFLMVNRVFFQNLFHLLNLFSTVSHLFLSKNMEFPRCLVTPARKLLVFGYKHLLHRSLCQVLHKHSTVPADCKVNQRVLLVAEISRKICCFPKLQLSAVSPQKHPQQEFCWRSTYIVQWPQHITRSRNVL